MPAPPVISVSLRRDGRNAVLELRNETESELTNESLSHVFERFYRTDSSRNSATGGHGIGLSMASAIVNAQGGRISARTSNGHDFIVTATLPAA
jgi:signal transduction histidine kinase